jgi:hypothetical protein
VSARLPSELLVGAMLRRANDAGGFGVVRARGEADGGAILVIATEGRETTLLERGLGPDGLPAVIESHPSDSTEEYWRRRRARDPDLWVIELDIPQAKRLVAETLRDD